MAKFKAGDRVRDITVWNFGCGVVTSEHGNMYFVDLDDGDEALYYGDELELVVDSEEGRQ